MAIEDVEIARHDHGLAHVQTLSDLLTRELERLGVVEFTLRRVQPRGQDHLALGSNTLGPEPRHERGNTVTRDLGHLVPRDPQGYAGQGRFVGRLLARARLVVRRCALRRPVTEEEREDASSVLDTPSDTEPLALRAAVEADVRPLLPVARWDIAEDTLVLGVIRFPVNSDVERVTPKALGREVLRDHQLLQLPDVPCLGRRNDGRLRGPVLRLHKHGVRDVLPRECLADGAGDALVGLGFIDLAIGDGAGRALDRKVDGAVAEQPAGRVDLDVHLLVLDKAVPPFTLREDVPRCAGRAILDVLEPEKIQRTYERPLERLPPTPGVDDVPARRCRDGLLLTESSLARLLGRSLRNLREPLSVPGSRRRCLLARLGLDLGDLGSTLRRIGPLAWLLLQATLSDAELPQKILALLLPSPRELVRPTGPEECEDGLAREMVFHPRVRVLCLELRPLVVRGDVPAGLYERALPSSGARGVGDGDGLDEPRPERCAVRERVPRVPSLNVAPNQRRPPRLAADGLVRAKLILVNSDLVHLHMVAMRRLRRRVAVQEDDDPRSVGSIPISQTTTPTTGHPENMEAHRAPRFFEGLTEGRRPRELPGRRGDRLAAERVARSAGRTDGPASLLECLQLAHHHRPLREIAPPPEHLPQVSGDAHDDAVTTPREASRAPVPWDRRDVVLGERRPLHQVGAPGAVILVLGTHPVEQGVVGKRLDARGLVHEPQRSKVGVEPLPDTALRDGSSVHLSQERVPVRKLLSNRTTKPGLLLAEDSGVTKLLQGRRLPTHPPHLFVRLAPQWSRGFLGLAQVALAAHQTLENRADRAPRPRRDALERPAGVRRSLAHAEALHGDVCETSAAHGRVASENVRAQLRRPNSLPFEKDLEVFARPRGQAGEAVAARGDTRVVLDEDQPSRRCFPHSLHGLPRGCSVLHA